MEGRNRVSKLEELEFKVKYLEECMQIQADTIRVMNNVLDLISTSVDLANKKIGYLKDDVDVLKNGDDLK